MNEVGHNSCKAWILASRPKTLSGAVAPVIVATATALGNTNWNINWLPCLLCFLFAILMQIDANLINDYFDGMQGRDGKDRIGPPRACTMGWIDFTEMRKGIGIVTFLACLSGLPLMYYGGWWMLLVGFACVLFCFLYTTSLAKLGFGDLLVLCFFGIVPVNCTYYILTGEISQSVMLYSLAMGLVTDLLLIVNNYRDRLQDKYYGKKTLVVILGERTTENIHSVLGIIAVGLCVIPLSMDCLTLFPFLILHGLNHNKLVYSYSAKAMNKVLGMTAASIFLFSILLSIAILIH